MNNQVFFTSDTHFGHTNIIDYCERPCRKTDYCSNCRGKKDEERHELHVKLGCPDVVAMDEMIIRNWNAVVGEDDEVFHLGDFTFYKDADKVERILTRLNGRKYFIWGNHDKVFHKNQRLIDEHFVWAKDYHELKLEAMPPIILIHYPLLTWNHAHHGAYHLHGHNHGGVDHLDTVTTRMDVGLDAIQNNMTPVSLDQVISYMTARKYQAVDHHKSAEEEM